MKTQRRSRPPPPNPEYTPSLHWDGIIIPTGIIDDPVVVSHDFICVENAWQYFIDDEYVRVYAGCLSDDREQGVIAYETDSSSRQVLNAPKKSGALKIVEEKNNGETLVLKAKNGDTFYFDVQSRKFVTDLDNSNLTNMSTVATPEETTTVADYPNP